MRWLRLRQRSKSRMTTVELADHFTSRGNKFWHHPEALEGLRNGKPRPVVSHIMLTDICQHKCAFCSVQTREGNTLTMEQIRSYVEALKALGLKAIILSGGGNPILYKSKDDDFNTVVDYLHGLGLEIGLITNGMPMREYVFSDGKEDWIRNSWKTVAPETLDKLTWIRISMSGLDHHEHKVFVPDIDEGKTTLGFSYIAHDAYEVPQEPNHGQVSTEEDLRKYGGKAKSVRRFEDRITELTQEFTHYVTAHNPRYIRLLPNCLQPDLIDKRCEQLQQIANAVDPTRLFVQHKPPQAPPACYLGYLHPVLNSDGYVYPCDSCVLNKAADHKFAVPWRVCRWDQIAMVYSKPARSLINRPDVLCPGCVFNKSNQLLTEIANGREIEAPTPVEHPSFV